MSHNGLSNGVASPTRNRPSSGRRHTWVGRAYGLCGCCRAKVLLGFRKGSPVVERRCGCDFDAEPCYRCSRRPCHCRCVKRPVPADPVADLIMFVDFSKGS